MQVTYILAGYNEEAMIESSIERCISALEHDFDDYELILVDDASTDHTGEIMEQAALKNQKVKVLHNLVNLNFGASVLRGMMAAQKEWVVYNAVDLPVYPEEAADILRTAQDYDVLVLERANYNAVFWRKITSNINTVMLHILFPRLMRGTPITNYTQVFRKDCIKSCLPLARSPIFVWPEMIFRAKLLGLRVGNLVHTPHIEKRRKGAFGKPHDICWGIYDMLRFRVRLWQNKI